MDEDDTFRHAVLNALIDELDQTRLAQQLSFPEIAARTGGRSETIRRAFRRERPISVLELLSYADALDFDYIDLLTRAEERARNLLRPESPSMDLTYPSSKLRTKLSLIATSANITIDLLYRDLAVRLAHHGYHFPRRDWHNLLAARGPKPLPQVLAVIADTLNVDPRYLSGDDPAVDRAVEAKLHEMLG